MRTSLRRRVAVLIAVASVLASFAVVAAPSAVLAGTSDGDCPFADVISGTECEIHSPWTIGGGGVGSNNFPAPLPGPFLFKKDLHIYAGGSIRAVGTAGITLTITGASGGTGALLMDAGASVIDTSEDGSPPNSGAGPMIISATGGAQLAAGSVIKAENTTQGGNAGPITMTLGASSSFAGTISSQALAGTTSNDGGDITITVSGDLTLAAGSLITSEKNADSGESGDISITVSGDMTMEGGDPGAVITANHPGATNGTPGGNITIAVGTGDAGIFTMEDGSKVDSGGAGFAGNIKINAGEAIDIQEGAEVLAGQIDEQTTRGHGGRIFLISGCDVEVAGTVSSQGHDPGADLVHLEGCLVHIAASGLVESTGAAHEPGTPSSCDSTDDNNASRGGDAGEVLRDHADNSTVCVEIWARHVVIDAGGEVNADYALGGADIQGHGWIDIFAETDITIAGPAAGVFAVHSNSEGGNDTGGDVTVKARNDFVALSGQALQANATANGGKGGHVIAAAGGDVSFGTSIVEARGSAGGSAPSGGTIEGLSDDDLTGSAPGKLDASGDGAGSPGSISLQGCTVSYTGATTPGASTSAVCAGTPSFPGYVEFNPNGRWDRCGESSISGMKFEDLDGDGVKDNGEPGLDGWTIHVTGPGFDDTAVTTNGGLWAMPVPGGQTYLVCEVLLDNTWTQTYPAPGVACGQGEGPNGHSVDVNTDGACCGGDQVEDVDFGNLQLASKSGTKYDDQANDATPPFEATLDSWTIHVFGTDGKGNPVALSTQTGPNGTYSFPGLWPGTYTVCEVLEPNWTQTYPSPGTDGNACENAGYSGGGYGFTLVSGQDETGNDFANHSEPVFDEPQCQKQTVIDTMNAVYPGNGGPDDTVLTYLPESVQTAVDNATDSNLDGYIIVMVIAHADGSLGGTANQKVVVDKNYGTAKPFGLFGCSVTLTGGGSDPAVWIKSSALSKQILVSGKKTTIFVMDLHGGNSAVGVQTDGTYRYLRNEYGIGNGIGIALNGNYNVVHNGQASGNSGDGLVVTGNYNYLTDTDVMSNGGGGVTVSGNNNQLLKLDVGDKGEGNTLDGVHVVGNTNTLSEIESYASGGDGFDVAGSSNTLTKNIAGTKGKGNGGDGFLIVGASNTLTENKASTNAGDGFDISGALASGTANKLKNNLSNTSSAGDLDYENAAAEWRLLNWIKNNGGGNKADGTTLASGVKGLTNFPASGSTFNYAAVQTAE